jgi:hypothetical protein
MNHDLNLAKVKMKLSIPTDHCIIYGDYTMC